MTGIIREKTFETVSPGELSEGGTLLNLRFLLRFCRFKSRDELFGFRKIDFLFG